MPQLGASGARRAFRLSAFLPRSWDVSARLRDVARVRAELPFAKGAPSSLLGGPGILMLPHDPCRAVGLLPHVRRIIRALDGQVAIACSSEVRPWLPSLPAEAGLTWPAERDGLVEWCRETASARRSWAWCLDEAPDAGALAALAWLGGERRIASNRPGYARVANVRIASMASDPSALESSRMAAAAALGLALGAYAMPAPSRGGSVLLEIPVLDGAREIRRWTDLAAKLAASHPLIVAHCTDLSPEVSESLRALGNRLSLLRISRPDDICRLGGEVRVWIARVGPASILASQAGCPVLFLGGDDTPSREVGPLASPGAPCATYLGSRNPTPAEVLRAVLDLPASGM